MAGATRLLLVEDHAAFGGALALVLGERPGVEVVAQAGSVAECRALGEALATGDLALPDLALPDGDGADLVGDLRAANPSARVLVLTASLDAGNAARASSMGVDGFLDKMAPLEEIAADTRARRPAGTNRPSSA